MITAVHAALQAGIADPILVSQDADLLGASSSLISAVTDAFHNPLLDTAAGPILYSGCDPSGRPLYGERLLPELYIGGKYLSAADESTLSGRMTGVPDIFTPGANSAFRLASMCAAGGYNRTFGGMEDIDIGQRIKAMRRQPGDECFFHEERVAFLRQAWISTSPRRGLAAILQGAALNEQWQSFFGLVSAELDDDALATRYEQQPNLLQVRDVQAAVAGDPFARTKMRARIRNIFGRSVRQDGITDGSLAQALARGMGLCVTRVTMRERLAPRIHVDWKRSALLGELHAWVARWNRDS